MVPDDIEALIAATNKRLATSDLVVFSGEMVTGVIVVNGRQVRLKVDDRWSIIITDLDHENAYHELVAFTSEISFYKKVG